MTATLELRFEDGTSRSIELEKVLVFDMPGESLEFRKARDGRWLMTVTTGLLGDKKLADEFLTVKKNLT